MKTRSFTPTYLSSFVMLALLPAQIIVAMRPVLAYNGQPCPIKNRDYILKPLLLNGIETYEISKIAATTNQAYQIYYCANAEDALRIKLFDTHLTAQPDTKHIFWNYPGVGRSVGPARSTHDLIKTGYQQVKRLLDQGIPANKITLYGRSLGGGVAAQVALRLHEEGHLVHLKIDRSFAQLAPVVPGMLKANQQDTPFITTLIALSISGLAIGTLSAELIASIGANLTRQTTPDIALFINNAFDIIGSVIGAIIAITGLLAGITVGLALGTLLSTQYIWTDKPVTFPMTPAFSTLLNSTSCEMDSVRAIHSMLAADNRLENRDKARPHIHVINTLDDEIITVPASLNAGLGFKHDEAPHDNETSTFKQNINSMWYQQGGHNHALNDRIPTPAY